MTYRKFCVQAALSAMVLSMGCDRAQLSGPPELRLGRTECAACGMLINEDRCSSAFLITERGRRDHLCFDDIGCMIDYEQEPDDGVLIIEGFVHDYDTRAWFPTSAAVFLLSDADALPTPMASGIVAFGARPPAEEALEEFGGQLMDYTELREARRAWMEARYGKKKPSTTSP